MKSAFIAYWYLWVIFLLLIVWLLFRLYRPKTDIKWEKLDPNLQWDSVVDESLSKIYKYVVAFSDSTILWYQSRRRPKRYFGVSLRVGALVATAAAGLVPLSENLINVLIPPVWSTVLVAFAGVFVSVDVLGGYTSGWVRYMLAQQKVERLRDAFLLEWNALKVAQTNAQGMLERAKTFLLAVGKVVDDETQEWATEFQNALKEMEKARKTAAEIERTGAIEVSVKNPQTVTGWTLEIDGSQRGQTSGKNLAITDVLVGIRKLKVYGQDAKGKTFSDEKTVKVEGGATVTKELELS
jgi:hypothetical protein